VVIQAFCRSRGSRAIGLAHGLGEVVSRHRFDEVAVDANCGGLGYGFGFGLAGEHDDGRLIARGSKALDELQAGQAGHVLVSQDEIRVVLFDRFERFRPVGRGGEDLVAIALQDSDESTAEQRIIFYNDKTHSVRGKRIVAYRSEHAI
jgi:hypothetical protein